MIDCGRPVVFQLLHDIVRRGFCQVLKRGCLLLYFLIGIILLFSFNLPGKIAPLFRLPFGNTGEETAPVFLRLCFCCFFRICGLLFQFCPVIAPSLSI